MLSHHATITTTCRSLSNSHHTCCGPLHPQASLQHIEISCADAGRWMREASRGCTCRTICPMTSTPATKFESATLRWQVGSSRWDRAICGQQVAAHRDKCAVQCDCIQQVFNRVQKPDLLPHMSMHAHKQTCTATSSAGAVVQG